MKSLFIITLACLVSVVLAFVFLPLSFIAGLFGMNTVNNPIIGSSADFWILCGIMLAVAVGCFVYFRHKGWL